MEKEWGSLDSTSLLKLYHEYQEELQNALLSGAEWKDVQEKRNLLIQLARMIQRTSAVNPAEFQNRKGGNSGA